MPTVPLEALVVRQHAIVSQVAYGLARRIDCRHIDEMRVIGDIHEKIYADLTHVHVHVPRQQPQGRIILIDVIGELRVVDDLIGSLGILIRPHLREQTVAVHT